MLPSLVTVKLKMDSESAFQPGLLCATLRSFCQPCCFHNNGANGRRTTFFVTTGACLSMRECRPSLYWVTRQSRASDGSVMRLKCSMLLTKAPGSMPQSRRKEIGIDGKRGDR